MAIDAGYCRTYLLGQFDSVENKNKTYEDSTYQRSSR